MKRDLICIGAALVDSIIRGFDPEPISASGYRAASGSLNVGGEAVNEAITAAKLGLSTGILCGLGCDGAAEMITAALEQYGVRTEYIVRGAEHATPVTTMFVRDDGSRKSITNGAHRYNFHPERYPEAICAGRAISVDSLFRAPFDDPAIIAAVLRAAKESGALVFADTKLPNFTKLTLDDIRESLPLIDYIFPNESEAMYYTGETAPQRMAEVFMEYGANGVIVKLGEKGCYMRSKNGEYGLPAHPIHAVDATGAGDNFIAGFIAQKLSGADDAKALTFANACGAICTTAVGAAGGLKDSAQVEAFLQEGA